MVGAVHVVTTIVTTTNPSPRRKVIYPFFFIHNLLCLFFQRAHSAVLIQCITRRTVPVPSVQTISSTKSTFSLPFLAFFLFYLQAFIFMGQETHSKSSGVLSRPCFTPHLNSAFWTDGNGPQDECAGAGTYWCYFHNLLPDSNSNKQSKKLRCPILNLQCFGREKKLVKSIHLDMLSSNKEA